MEQITELKENLIETWAKEVDKFRRHQLNNAEVESFMKYSLNEEAIDSDSEIIKLLETKNGGMASIIWLRIKHCHTYSISPALVIHLSELIDSPGMAVMICNYLQYKCHSLGIKNLNFKNFSIKIFPMGYISKSDWNKAWDMQKLKFKCGASDNMLDYPFCMKSINDISEG